MSIRISLLVRLESSVLQQCSMVLGTCDHLFSVSLPSKKLWYLLVSIAGSLIHLVNKEEVRKERKGWEMFAAEHKALVLIKTVEWQVY